MKRFNMKTLSLITSLSSLALLMACDDSITNNDPVTTQAYANQEEFPECEEASEGYFAMVSSSKDLYICTANEWVNISKAGSSAKPGCSSQELENGKGVKIICNGDSVAVLNYGTQGTEGDKGDDGHKGETGDKGQPGSSSNGKDAVWDTDRCKLKNAGFDVMVYDCGDSTYVSDLPLTGGNTSNVWKPWPNIQTGYSGSTLYTFYNNQFESNATGSLKRYEGDTWGSSSYTVSLTANDLYRDDFQIKGTAKVEVTTAQAVTAEKYRPFVGVKATFSNNSFKSRLGLCLTYSSEKDMALLVEGKTGFIKANVPATKGKEKIVNVVWDDFEPVAKEVNADTVIRYVKGVYVEAVGGEEAGTYENKFSIAQLGDLGNCDGKSYANSPWKAYIENLATPVTGFTLGGVTYKAVKIGNLTWMTENMRYATASEVCDYSSDATGCPNYGRKYTWAQAKAACTAAGTGWRLPTIAEWGALVETMSKDFEGNDIKLAHRLALNAEGSYNGKNLSGMNLYAYPNNAYAHMWSSTGRPSYETTHGLTFYYDLSSGELKGDGTVVIGSGYMGDWQSSGSTYPIRCVKD